ncbi:hypothetical protein ES705_32518 [subsurface metagenome]
MKVWNEEAEVVRRLALGAIVGFLIAINSDILGRAGLLAVFVGGYFSIDVLEALLYRFKKNSYLMRQRDKGELYTQVSMTRKDNDELVKAGFETYKDEKVFLSDAKPPKNPPVYVTTGTTTGRVGADEYWKNFKGKGVKVCVLDTGVDKNHLMMRGQVIAEKIFFKSRIGRTGKDWTPTDYNNHGTWVASALAGKLFKKPHTSGIRTFRGIAPEAKIINAKVLNKSGRGFASSVLYGMDWACQQGADIVSASIGMGGHYQPIIDTIHTLQKKYGTIFVFSAGNAGERGGLSCPAYDPEIIAVGSIALKNPHDGFVADFSSRGNPDEKVERNIKPDFVTYGGSMQKVTKKNRLQPHYNMEWLISACSSKKGDGVKATKGMIGTSMATPLISGMIALLMSRYGKQTQKFYKTKLAKMSTQVIGQPKGKNRNSGYGAPDLRKDV